MNALDRDALPPVTALLSAREREVVALLHAGLTQKEIAYQLHLTHSTVRVHLLHARDKTALAAQLQPRVAISR
jgi:DNA-binding CsgD family transcriptional regulator